MRQPHLQLHLSLSLLLLLLLPSLASAADSDAQSITLHPNWGDNAICVQHCFVSRNPMHGCDEDNLARGVGCPNDGFSSCRGDGWGARNPCYCRPDIRLDAAAYLSGCIEANCTNGSFESNYRTATSMYLDYCSRAGYPAAAEATTTAGEGGGGGVTASSGCVAASETGDSAAGRPAGPPSRHVLSCFVLMALAYAVQ